MVYTRSQYQRKMESEQEQLATPVDTQNVNSINSVLSEQNANNEPENELINLFLENTDDKIADEVPSVPSPVPSISNLDPFEKIMLLLEQTNKKLDNQQAKADSQYRILQDNLNKKLDDQLAVIDKRLDLQQKTFQKTLEKQRAEFREDLARQEQRLDERLAKLQLKQDLFQQQLNDKDKLWNERSTQIQNQYTNLQTTVETIQQTYCAIPQTLSNLETNFQKLQSTHNSIEADINKLTTQVQEVKLDQDANIREKFSAHEKLVVSTFNTWIKDKDNLIKQQLEQELPKAIHSVSQQILENKTSADDDFKAEIEALKKRIESVTANEVQSVITTNRSINNSPSARLSKRLHTDEGEDSQSSGSSSEANNDDYRAVRRARMTASDRLVKNKPFQVFSPDKKQPHPFVFIKSFESSLPKYWPERDKIAFTTAYLHGESALWGADAVNRYRTFHQFEKAFLEKYWSENMQEKIRDEINNPKPFTYKKGTLRKYFETYLDKTRHFNEPMPTKEVLRLIKSKLPTNIKRELLYAPVKDIDAFMQAVDNIDLLHEEDMRQSNQNNNCNQYQAANAVSKNQYPNGNGNNNYQPNNGSNGSGNNFNGNNNYQQQQNGNGQFQRNRKGHNRYHPGYNNSNNRNNSQGNFQRNQNNNFNQNSQFSRNNSSNQQNGQYTQNNYRNVPPGNNMPNQSYVAQGSTIPWTSSNPTQPIRTLQVQGQPPISLNGQEMTQQQQFVWEPPQQAHNVRLVEVEANSPNLNNEQSN